MKYNKIFQIGFNKTATSSISNLFNYHSNPITTSIHWNYGYLARTIYNNIYSGHFFPLFGYGGFDVFCDMECFIKKENEDVQYISIFKDYFDLLDINYPNSLFILNIRNIDNWIKSRLKHKSNCSIISNNGKVYRSEYPIRYVDVFKKVYHTNNEKDVTDIWQKEYTEHIENVHEYFSLKERQLLVYDIEQDDFSKFQNFFSNYNISFNTDRLPHANKTND